MSTPITIDRHVQRAGGVQLHFREAGVGNGPGLVLLHASPRSSAMFEPWMRMLAPHFHVLAIDTPGYGGSEALSGVPLRMPDYVAPMRELAMDRLANLRPKPMVYGTATGAQLGIAWAKAYPEDMRHLLLDNAAHFTDAERSQMLERYFVDLTPRADGSHLLAAWRMCTQMAEFFPWYANDEAHRVAPRPAASADVHAAVLEMLAAGPGYAAAYRAAFEHERAENVQALTVPTTFFRWEASVLRKHIDALLAHPMPLQLRVVDTPAPPMERYAAMTAHLLGLR